MRNQFFGLWWGYRLANLAAQPFPPVVTLVPMMLAAMLVLSACGGGGGGGLAAGPVVYVEGTDRLANPQQGSSESATDGDIYYRGAAGGDAGELGVPTPGTVPNPAHYETAEYFASGSPAPLATGKFSTAYARGWTGHGSLVAIADTGVDADHPDLAANIAASRDFTGTVNDDRHGHGTHVAGIVAAVKDGAGVHGGAFDAVLAIGKAADTRAYDFQAARQTAAWARDMGSVAVNVSAAHLRDNDLERRLVQIGPGDYYIDHPTYGQSGFYNVKHTASAWRDALGPRQVLVKAAGNNNTSYSAAVNQLATATDSNGRLMLNGQMLVVGNWDTARQQIRGNLAGNVCTSWNGACLDAAKVSDSFILAPGTGVKSTYLNGSYATMSGTSMAAPMVSAAVAILHQMWPHLDGRQLAGLLLSTADKNLPGYAPHTHGQGLLDMDRATQPVGEIAVPVSDDVEGDVIDLEAGGAMAAIAPAAMAALSEVMVLDDYRRDFYVDLGRGLKLVDTRRSSAVQAGGLTDGYAGYFNPDSHLRMRTELLPHLSLVSGLGREEKGFLGNSLSGALGSVKASHTVYGLINFERGVGQSDSKLFAQLGGGVTMIDRDEAPSLLHAAAPALSQTATMGVTHPFNGGVIGAVISQPAQLARAVMTYRLPTARTLNGDVSFDHRDVNFRPAQRETDFGLFFRREALDGRFSAEQFLELRQNAPHAGEKEVVTAGMRFRLSLQ